VIAAIVVVGLTTAVVVLAINNGGSTTASPATRASSSAIFTNPSAETGARLNHSGRLEPSLSQVGLTSNYRGHFKGGR
jgi:hypothetical protein